MPRHSRVTPRSTSAGARALALCALAALPLLAGCNADSSRVLARVGSRTITVDEFEEVAGGNESQYPGPPDSAKAQLLQDLVRRALLLEDAQRTGFFAESLAIGYRRNVTDQALTEAVYDRLAPRNIPVSEAEVEKLHAWRDSASHMRVIYTASRAAAGAAVAELARGAAFGTIADRYGLTGYLPPGGDLGFLSPGSLVTPLDRYLREAPLGQLIGPVEAPGDGWFVLQVIERRSLAQPPLDLRERVVLRDMLLQRKQRIIALRAVADLRSTFAMRLEPGGPQALFACLNGPESPIVREPGQSPTPQRPEVLATVLARYDQGRERATYTIADALEDYNKADTQRPSPTMLPSIERWIETQCVRRLAVLEARRRHLDEEPDVIQRVNRRVDNYVLDGYYNTVIAPLLEVTEADARAAYDRAKGRLTQLESVQLLEATIADSATAAQLVMHAGHAPSLREAVAMAAPGTKVTEETVRFPNANAEWRPFEEAFHGMGPRECVGPLRVAQGWRVLQIVSKAERTQPFETLSPEMAQWIHQQAIERKRDVVLDDVVARLKGSIRTEVHPERLKVIPWPIPATPSSQG